MSTTRVLLKAPRARILLCGEYDVASQGELRCRFSAADQSGCHEVYLDVALVTFIDCAALGVIVAARRRLVAAGGTMTVIGATPRFERVCRLSGYLELLDGDPSASARPRTG